MIHESYLIPLFVYYDDWGWWYSAPPQEKQKVKSSSSYPSSYSHILNVGTGRALKIEDLA
jgi:hypothetical protein